uniref:Uncharacterized protein n=1 Tax=Rhizophagus irregularis (strain DAOM 181602 / DAOM 197198 / MUCL 43194) TaxID=747089 RepID=U9TKM5_RHIID
MSIWNLRKFLSGIARNKFGNSPRNALEKLRLDLSNWIKNNGGGWKGRDAAQSIGKKFVTDLTSALWYIDSRSVETLNQKFKIPVIFDEFFGRSQPESYKSARPKFNSDELIQQNKKILNYVKLSWMLQNRFNWLKESLYKFGEILAKYSEYLDHQQIRSKEIKNSLTPIVNEIEVGSIEIFSANIWPEFWKPLNVNEFCPEERMKRHRFIEGLDSAFLFKVGVYKYYHGTAQNVIYIWQINLEANETEIINKNYEVRTKLKAQLQIFHIRAMKKELIENFELQVGKCEKARLRHIISDLLGDFSASENSASQKVDERVDIMIELGDPEFISDLRHLNSGPTNCKYDTFWNYGKKYFESTINETVLTVDERRHDMIQHLAQAISIRDLRQQVTNLCPPDTEIPSEQWVRLQFWPRNPTYLSSLKYTGKLDAKFMVQSRQLRCNHIDSHYASALFQYLKELAITFKDYSWLIFMDDKHRCKVGEPGYPVAAVERGKQVIVSCSKSFIVSDHDFTKCEIIPSVIMFCDIPTSIEESFYQGKVYARLKDSIFQPSNPMRHNTELYNLLKNDDIQNPFLFIYTDGGPDHRVNYLQVQLSLISLFMSLDLDLLVAVRTPSGHSWKNPVERIMSILNLGLQCIGLMRTEMDKEFEELIKCCNSMEDIRNKAKEEPHLKEQFLNSLFPTIELMENLIKRLELKEEPFETFKPASEEEMTVLWNSLLLIDDSLTIEDNSKKNCHICNPVRCDTETWLKIHNFPDPIPTLDGKKYKSFEELYGKETTEEYRPSLKEKKKSNENNNEMGFRPSTLIQCGECDKWHVNDVIYSKSKLSSHENDELTRFLDEIQYTCSDTFYDISSSKVNNTLTCNSPIEILYYSSKLFKESLCFNCGAECEEENNYGEYFPYCEDCSASVKNKKRRSKENKFVKSSRCKNV